MRDRRRIPKIYEFALFNKIGIILYISLLRLPQIESLNNSNVFSRGPGGEKSKVKVLAELVPALGSGGRLYSEGLCLASDHFLHSPLFLSFTVSSLCLHLHCGLLPKCVFVSPHCVVSAVTAVIVE